MQSPEQQKQMQEAYQQAMADPEVRHFIMGENAVQDACGITPPPSAILFSRNVILNSISES